MTNFYYTEVYQDYRNSFDVIFSSEHLIKECEIVLSEEYMLRTVVYESVHNGYRVMLQESFLIYNGEVVYTFKNVDSHGPYCSIISHNDGNRYMIFKCDLYGYSVLNLNTMDTFHYFPKCSFNQEETFIWVDFNYNLNNNILAVVGCYWAAPYSVILVDFERPMEPVLKWVDIHAQIDYDYEKYSHIDFASWQGSDLLLECDNYSTEQKERLLITEEEYMAWFNQ